MMDWRWICDKQLSEPVVNRFTDAYMQHKGEMGLMNAISVRNFSFQLGVGLHQLIFDSMIGYLSLLSL